MRPPCAYLPVRTGRKYAVRIRQGLYREGVRPEASDDKLDLLVTKRVRS